MKKTANKKRNVILLVLAVMICLAAAASIVMAKYTAERSKQMEMLSQGFHISSSLLSADSTPSYDVSNVASGIDIDLCNYEQENTANIAEMDITYTVSPSSGWVVEYVKGAAGNNLSASSGVYTFPANTTAAKQIIHLVRTDSTEDSVTVTVKTTSPYVKELKATFKVSASAVPTWTLKQDSSDSNHVILTVKTNGYSGSLTLSWNSTKLAPDNTNSLMAGWTGVSSGTTTALTAFSTYEFIFYKNDSTSYSETNGSGASIQVGDN